jgi:hypothetical protein
MLDSLDACATKVGSKNYFLKTFFNDDFQRGGGDLNSRMNACTFYINKKCTTTTTTITTTNNNINNNNNTIIH